MGYIALYWLILEVGCWRIIFWNDVHPENGTSFLPDQIWGLYIGWAKFDGQKAVKAVFSIGWSISCCGSKRKIVSVIL